MADNHFKIHKGVTLAPQSSAPSNPTNGDIYYDSTFQKFRKYENGAWTDLGAGNGSGKNYIKNPDFETGLGDTGTDGSGNVTIALETSDPLRDSNSATISVNTAANSTQYAYMSMDPVDPIDYEGSKPLLIKFDYYTSASYIDDDIEVYLRRLDATAADIPLLSSSGLIKKSSEKTTFVGLVELDDDASNYELRFRSNGVASTVSVTVDNVTVGPQTFTAGAIVTRPEAYTPILNSGTNVSVNEAHWYRIGRFMHIEGVIEWSGTGSGILELDIPTGHLIDTAYLFNSADTVLNKRGDFQFYDGASTNGDSGSVVYFSSNSVRFLKTSNSSYFPQTDATSADRLSYQFKVPIVGWTDSTVISNTEAFLKNAQVTADISTASHNSSGTFLDIVWTETRDRLNNFDGTTFTAARSDLYIIMANAQFSDSSTTGVRTIRVVDGSGTFIDQGQGIQAFSGTFNTAQYSMMLYLNEGDTIKFQGFQNSGTTVGYQDGKLAIASLSDITTYGVYANEEYIEAISTATFTSQSGISNLSWTVIDSTFNIELTPGEWEIGFVGPVQGFSTAGNFITQWAISNSSTAGTGIITSNFGGNVHTTGAADRYSNTTMHIGNYIISSDTTLYIQARPIDQGSLGTATIGYGNAAGGDVKLWARRIK